MADPRQSETIKTFLLCNSQSLTVDLPLGEAHERSAWKAKFVIVRTKLEMRINYYDH